MSISKSPKLKISFITTEEINKNIVDEWLPRAIAESIYEKPEFQKLLQQALNPSNI